MHPKFLQSLKDSNNESELISLFEHQLQNDISRLLGEATSNTPIRFKKEIIIEDSTYRHSLGRIDTQINQVIIEYKRYHLLSQPAKLKKAKEQLLEYLKNRKTPVGFLVDGERIIKSVRAADGSYKEEYNEPLTVGTYNDLITTIYACDNKEATAENLIDIVKHSAYPFRSLVTLLFELEFNKRSKMLFKEWENNFGIAHDNRIAGTKLSNKMEDAFKAVQAEYFIDVELKREDFWKALFCINTAYTILLKIITSNILERTIGIAKPLEGTESVLISIENGSYFQLKGFKNLVEPDYFNWYTKQLPKKAWGDLQTIFWSLSRLNWDDLTGVNDVFRPLYEACFPPQLRKALGEFFTPEFLCDLSVNDLIKQGANIKYGKWLDPTCGSGGFILAIIKAKLAQGCTPQEILQTVFGVDVNCISVLTARLNYVIALKDFFRQAVQENETKQGFIIPIFWGDITNEVQTAGANWVYTLETTVKEPVEVKIKASNLDDLFVTFSAAEKRIANDNPKTEWEQTISNWHREDLNGIWCRILLNQFAASSLSNFDVVVGNPPWIDWKNLPSAFQKRLAITCSDRGLFSKDRQVGGISLNICAFIAYVAQKRLLKPQGQVGLLMPKELLYQKSYEGWREKMNPNLALVIDYASFKPNPFISVTADFCNYIFKFQ